MYDGLMETRELENMHANLFILVQNQSPRTKTTSERLIR